jgi:class 3 adenylate cyclase
VEVRVEAERRQVTVLFVDMVGYTPFSERAGEEAAFALVRKLSKLMDEAVRQHGGFVQSFSGDGMMAVFGAPVALEDAPIRACRAALSILQRVEQAGPELQRLHGVRPQVRLGLNTGVAVVGQIQDDERAGVAVLGDTVNLASRLQTMAAPNSVLLSQSMYRAVQGMVEASFAGEHSVKGKSDPQKMYHLTAIHHGASRFDASKSRGLSPFVGRERELEVLEGAFVDARLGLRVIDLVAEPGMGKSRLLHEFRARTNRDNPFVLTGSCSPDGRQTAFLPFIEVMRTSFRISAGDSEKEIAQKLEVGLTALGLHSLQNVGLLLHLLGLTVPDGALTGLDGALIGLRTRKLSQQLLEARCHISPVIMLIEDVHWIDSMSEELLSKIIDGGTKLRLLIVTTRRPERVPLWLDRTTVVTKLPLTPLPAGDIRRLIQSRLGVDVLPETLVHRVAAKVEGNPLFAEEIVSLLTDRAAVRAGGEKVKFDTEAAAMLPPSVQSVLNARIDQLAPGDRALLQAASVIGRRFDADLLGVVLSDAADIDARLIAMQALDLVRKEGNERDYSFKHALVQEALYQSLLTEARNSLHARIANEIERRSGNRLIEVAETLAHHYGHTNETAKAFAYLSMAGSRSLSVYSLDEAEVHFSAAIQLLEAYPECATDQQVGHILVEYTLLENALGRVRNVVEVPGKFIDRLERLGDSREIVLIAHQKVFALCFMTEFKAALQEQRKMSAMAKRLKDERSEAYAYASELLVSAAVAPKSDEEQALLVQKALHSASKSDGSYVRSVVRWAIAIDELSRGRMKIARDIAEEMAVIGRSSNDPRPIGMGMSILSWIALTSDDYEKALNCANECLRLANTPQERMNALGVKAAALVFLRKLDDGQKELANIRAQLIDLSWRFELLLTEPAFGVLAILNGQLSQGLRIIEDAVATARRDGWRVAEDWAKLFLCEIYLEVMFPRERPSPRFLLRNFTALMKVFWLGRSSIEDLVSQIKSNPQFARSGHHIGRTEMILGLLYKGTKKQALATRHLSEAKQILSQFGRTSILSRVETALADLAR